MTTEEDDKRDIERVEGRRGSDVGAVAAIDSDDKPDVTDPGDDNQPDAQAPMGQREFGPVEPPPPEPADVAPAPPPPPQQDFAPYAPTPAPKADTSRQDIAKALAGITSRKFTPSAAVNDEAIAKARSDRQAQVRKNDLSRAISDWLMRKPFTPTAPEDEAGQLLEQRGREQADFEKGQQRDLSAASLLARGLKGEKTPPVESQSLIDWRKAQSDRLKGLETRDAAAVAETQRKGTAATAAAEAEAASLEDERHALLRDPRAKAFGLTPEDITRLDRKGLDAVRKQLETTKPQKAPSGPGVAGVKPGDYSTVPADLRETVKAIAEGRAPAPSPGSKFGARILNYVTAVKPDFDSTRYGAYKKVTESQATDKGLAAVGVAREHLATARKLIPDNAGPQLINEFKLAFAKGSGSPEFTPFIDAASVAAHEVAKVYGIGDAEGKRMVEHLLSPAQSKEQLLAAFGTIDELIAGKQHAASKQLERARGGRSQTEPEESDPVVTLTVKDGRSKRVKKSAAEGYLKSHPGEATISE
jgi:hypothetical protein